MHRALETVAHRPWPLPERPWAWRQEWHDLLFAHWPVPPATLRPYLPSGLRLQVWDGWAWIGVVPFRMAGVMRRPLPDIPGVSAFPELNVRTYVEVDDRPGVWFLSLDAGSRLAVWTARALFNLPYYLARFDIGGPPEQIEYRMSRSGGDVEFRARYGPTGDVYLAQPGTLEHWLTERYCLYARSRKGEILCTEVHHRPWPLQPAEAEFDTNDMLAVHSLVPGRDTPVLHFSRKLDVVVWPSRPV